jgi:sirohydrochlorin ferrochelatase
LKHGRRRCRGMDSGARFASNTTEQNDKAAGWHFDQRMPRELQWRL